MTDSLAEEMHRCILAEARHFSKAQQLLTTRRYLASIRPGADGQGGEAEARICSICRDDLDDEMALTSCGFVRAALGDADRAVTCSATPV